MTKMYFEVNGKRFVTLKEANDYMAANGIKEGPDSVFEELGDHYLGLKELLEDVE